MLEEKYQKLRELLQSYGSCLVAYSGGVDSAFLAYAASRILGEKALAAIADTPSLPRRELREALELGKRFGFPVRVVRTREFEDPRYVANPFNRCYFCKKELFSELLPLAQEGGYAVIAYGENAEDEGDHRPGAKAAEEFAARAPLKEAGLTKADIRTLSARFGLPTADKPQMACLSSRIPYGEPVTPEKLRMVEEAEEALWDAGFRDVRVRHHELARGRLARIEVAPEDLARLLAPAMRERVTRKLQQIGYLYVTADLLGYRRGSLNEAMRLGPAKAASAESRTDKA